MLPEGRRMCATYGCGKVEGFCGHYGSVAEWHTQVT